MASFTNHVLLAPKYHLNVGPDLSAQLHLLFSYFQATQIQHISNQSSLPTSSPYKSASLTFLIALEKSHRTVVKKVGSGTGQPYSGSDPGSYYLQAVES